MFDAKQINELLRVSPFRPFRICMTNGKTYDVMHPEMAFPTASYILVAVTLNADNVPDDLARCAVLHIARVEDIPAETAA